MQNKIITSLYITLLLLFLASFGILRAQWTSMGPQGFGGSQYSVNQRMTIDRTTGAIFVASDDRDSGSSGRALNVRKYENGEWTQVGSYVVYNYYTNQIRFHSITVNPTTHQPVVVVGEYAKNYVSVFEFDGTAWNYKGDHSNIHTSANGSEERAAYVIFPNNVPWLVFKDGYSSSYGNLHFYKLVNDVWTRQTNMEIPNCARFSVLNPQGSSKIMVAYASYDATNQVIEGIRVRDWYNSKWNKVGGYKYSNVNNDTGALAHLPRIANTTNGNLFIAYRDDDLGNKITVRKRGTISWSVVGSRGFSGDITGDYAFTVDYNSNEPLVAYMVTEGTNKRLYVKRYTGGAWVSEGDAIDAGNINSDIRLEWNAKNDRIYVIYRDLINGNNNTVLTKCTSYSVTPTVTNVTCNGETNGKITLAVSGNTGTQTYYEWSNGTYNKNLTDVPADNYTCNIDDLGCITTINQTVSEPTAINASGNINHLTCPGDDNGSITQTVSGGSGSYTYLWNNGATTKNISGLAGGTYTCAITDNTGCSITAEYVVNAPEAIVAVETVTDPTCWGNPNGSISQVVTGGNGNYTYSWSNGKNTKDVTNLPNGTYTCTITDGTGCSIEKTYSVVQPGRIIVNSDIYHPVCYGGSSGSISLQVSGGVGSYTYQWNTGATTPDAVDIPSGNYNCTILDANGCGVSFGTTLLDPDEITATANVTDASNTNNGAIDLVPAGGSGNLSFSWSNGATTEDIEGLDSGAYAVTITDGHMCTASFNYTVNVSTGIHDELLKEMKLYPNPASDFVKINGTELSDFDVNIYDVSGSLVKSVTNVSSQQKIEINELQEGVYFVSISYQKSNRTLKLYVTRR